MCGMFASVLSIGVDRDHLKLTPGFAVLQIKHLPRVTQVAAFLGNTGGNSDRATWRSLSFGKVLYSYVCSPAEN